MKLSHECLTAIDGNMPMVYVALNFEVGLRLCRDELILLNLRNKDGLKKVIKLPNDLCKC